VSDNVVGQLADAFDFEFDRVTGTGSAHLKPAAAAVRAGLGDRAGADPRFPGYSVSSWET
jgi:hypothetical protein